MNEKLLNLVFVRHGESEGDVRRAAWQRGEVYTTDKTPEEEELTDLGIEQSRLAGLWIAQHILGKFVMDKFDGCYVSSSLRSEQSAVALGLADTTCWNADARLDERNRGLIRGIKRKEHQAKFPDSYEQMVLDPLHWVPPEGESLEQVAARFVEFHDDIHDGSRNIILVGHRDQMWSAQIPLEGLSEEEFLAVDTDEIHNAQVVHYTAINPVTGEEAPTLMWKRSHDPTDPSQPMSQWEFLPRIAAQYDYTLAK